MLGIRVIDDPQPLYLPSAVTKYQTFLTNYDAGMMGLGAETAGESLPTGLLIAVAASVALAGYSYYSCVKRGACAGFSHESKQRYLLTQRGKRYSY